MTRWLSMAGLAVVLGAAAVLSFAALRDLAIAVRVTEQLAFLLPIAVDAGAAVSCAVWLTPTAPKDARRYAAGLTWALLVLTVAANAAATGWHALAVTPPWWAAVVVGAIPPAVVGGVVHLLVLVGRDTPTVTDPTPAPPAPKPAPPKTRQRRDDAPSPDAAEPTPQLVEQTDLDKRAAELIANGAGRVRLQRELGVKEHRAKSLIKAHSNGHSPVETS